MCLLIGACKQEIILQTITGAKVVTAQVQCRQILHLQQGIQILAYL